MLSAAAKSQIGVCVNLTQAISRARTVEDIYTIALDALEEGLGVRRSSILLFDPDGVMRFKAYRGLSPEYRAAVEGHTPWTPDSADPKPIVVAEVSGDPSLGPYLPTIRAEGIAAMAFIPLVGLDTVIGKFMLYYDTPRELSGDELLLARVIASQVAFAVERTRAETQARRNEQRLRFALDAASMGTWDWDLRSERVQWSDNLERVHGLPPNTFDHTFVAYQREIHPDDRARVLGALQRTLEQGTPYEVEYRIVAPDGTVRWVEGKGRVEMDAGVPVGMTGICMNVTRRKGAELARLEAAQEASRLKDEFLATLSHELRTPLNAILGWVHLLEAGELPPDRLRHALEVIGRNARLQAQLIEDILDVSRIITGKLEIERLPVRLPQLLEQVVSAMLPAVEAKQIRLVSSVPSYLPPIEGDPKRIHQIVANVLANAVKFTPAGGRIAVQCTLDGDTVVIETRDTGAGIDPEFLPHVFERFRQADSRATRRHGGLGLGLAIARHLVEQHHGTIAAYSDGRGRGTTVAIRLPAGRIGSAGATNASAARRGPSAPPDLRGQNILVVDDQEDSRGLLLALFEQCGATVIQCASAASALERVHSTPVQLLVADIAMPETDGYELIRQVRSMGQTMPAIAVSAYARPQDRADAIAAGFNAYSSKPIDPAGLLQIVRVVLGISRGHREPF